MKIEIDLIRLKKENLSVDQFIILKLLYLKQYSIIKDFYGVKEAISIRNSLCFTPYLLSGTDIKFIDTLLSKENTEVLDKLIIGVRTLKPGKYAGLLQLVKDILECGKNTNQNYGLKSSGLKI